MMRGLLWPVLALLGLAGPWLLGGGGTVFSAFVLVAIFATMAYGLDIIVSDLGEVSLAHEDAPSPCEWSASFPFSAEVPPLHLVRLLTEKLANGFRRTRREVVVIREQGQTPQDIPLKPDTICAGHRRHRILESMHATIEAFDVHVFCSVRVEALAPKCTVPENTTRTIA